MNHTATASRRPRPGRVAEAPGRRTGGRHPGRGMAALLALGLAATLLVACERAPLLAEVTIRPESISPNQDGDADVAEILYQIGAPARLTIDLIGSDGTRHAFRQASARAPGSFVAEFGGVIDGRMLPDDTYQVVFRAEPAGEAAGPASVITRSLSLQGGDSEAPELAGFAVLPEVFTPNQDGLGDRVAISYRLDEPAEVRLMLLDPQGNYVQDILEDQAEADPPGLPGPKQYDFDAGVDADAPPPPDGRYTVVAEARDAVGNVSRVERPLEIRDGGQPRAAIVGDVAWSDTVVPLGGTLAFSTTVENIGGTPIRTRGPESGTVYDNTSTFNRQLPAGFLLLARAGGRPGDPGYRAASRTVLTPAGDVEGVELELVPGGAGAPAGPTPGEAATSTPDEEAATGAVDATATAGAGGPAATAPGLPGSTGLVELLPAAAESPPQPGVVPGETRLRLCGRVSEAGQPVAGAEVFAFEIDGDRGQRAESGADGAFCFDSLVLPPAQARTYARSPGAIRLGLAYDESMTDLEYPFRWQLGPTTALDVCESEGQRYLCLPPGGRVQVTGGIRFNTPPARRDTNVFLALMHEDVRRMHGPYGIQRVTVEY